MSVNLIVVSNTKDWSFEIPGVEVISARSYLTQAKFLSSRNARIFNLTRSYKYQTSGYYVSLLAAARGHRAFPDVAAIEEMKSRPVVQILGDDLDTLIQKSLHDLRSDKFTLSIYWGKNLSKKYDKLSLQLFNLFRSPLIRAQFVKGQKWTLQSISPIATSDIPADHKPYVEEYARTYFSARRFTVSKRQTPGYALAILVNPEEKTPPSCQKTIAKFQKAAEKAGLSVELITKDDYSRLAEFDALFIRETTAVNHHTFRFAQRAAAEGLVVIDDPDSIIRCTNKVYLAELMQINRVSTPKTLIVHKDNLQEAKDKLGFPCILKQPDSSFSQGVSKAKDGEEYEKTAAKLLKETSELIIAQEFMPTDFDWRVGILGGEPLYVCKYYMAQQHWQIVNWDKGSSTRQHAGKSDTLAVEDAPAGLIDTAIQAASLIGKGLYGVDIKEINGQYYIIEINDNPSIDTGVEDAILKDSLYQHIMNHFLSKIRETKESQIKK
ncbi:RimK family protein [Roseivirga sp. BDSF3-8]|uniref:RimK family protein n=1 Tax=Roseivirga sp. BDSF3-8 TaxID=3241598 RepID=UPI0035319FA8